jgi:hypothetical protein
MIMSAGPQKYPGASLSAWYQDDYPGSDMESNVVLWHSTETYVLPGYRGGLDAPNLTVGPDFAANRLRWWQHHDLDRSSRALVNAPGGVETNTLNVCQVEIIATCDPTTHAKWLRQGHAHLYTPELPDWAIRDLADFARFMHEKHGVPLTSDVTWKAYPGSYGASNGVRMSFAKWNGFSGHCGHEHPPENLHGDPGAFPMRAILDLARTGGDTEVPPVTTPIPPHPLTPPAYQDVMMTDAVPAPRNRVGYEDNPYWTLESYMRDIAEGIRINREMLAELLSLAKR